MKLNTELRVSIVIPVYNEQSHIAACLRAIAAQIIQPYEVIVVDNNSTDRTVEIAEGFPFVKVLREARQGVVFARNTGFDAARGDIIGRIDADTLIDTDWTSQLQRIFGDSQVTAVSGKVRYYHMAFSQTLSAIDLFFRRRLVRLIGREIALQGANMAMRASAWPQVRPQLCMSGGLHEDFDLGIHLNWLDQRLAFDELLTVSILCRQIDARWWSFSKYVLLSPPTYKLHGLTSRRHMYPIAVLLIIFFVPLKLLYRASGGTTFSSLKKLLAPAASRVNPATYVD